MRFLVVEDNVPLARILRAVLGRAGWGAAVDLTGDPDEALRWIEDVAYDLIVVDVRLPDALGGEIVCEVRRPGSLNEGAKVILTSGDAKLPDLASACGADAHLAKPFTSREVVETVADLLGLEAPGRMSDPGPPPQDDPD